jgi:uncharacterized membrane protein (UPF0127 family)
VSTQPQPLRLAAIRMLLPILALVGCQEGNDAWRERPPLAPLPNLTCDVTFNTVQGKVTVHANLAITPNETARGLMFRKEPLGESKGMLFVLRKEKNQVFHMKNTFIPLDLIFVNEAMEVVGIVERAQPKTLLQRQVDVPSRYVLEVDGGWCARHGVREGQTVQFAPLP